ncbi:hypothetical protein E4T56_gene13457 [Termitomyces sp. T112]|nr:hypothetical protein E4T56_gene13457 [Termitomyces sp. T112]KAH0588319.1 hypothetical protein H2248_004180 [Termitomyces sp. 'cryptogamus']
MPQGEFESHLIPVDNFKHAFTTSDHYEHHPSILHVPLGDEALGVHKVSSRTTHKLVTPPSPLHKSADGHNAPETAWEALYPKGSINPASELPGGFGFHLSGPKEFAQELARGATEAVFSYRMMLQSDWEWVKGGKLPGVFGGVGDLSYSCTGGRQQNRCQCFNFRPMWRPNSAGELYTYLPLTDTNSSVLVNVPPESKANNDYGFSVGRGSFHFDIAVGRWVSIAFRVKLNTSGYHNGEIQLWVDGESVMDIKGLSICNAESARIKGMHFQTFFGGHDESWASPKDQKAWFSDISGAILE